MSRETGLSRESSGWRRRSEPVDDAVSATSASSPIEAHSKPRGPVAADAGSDVGRGWPASGDGKPSTITVGMSERGNGLAVPDAKGKRAPGGEDHRLRPLCHGPALIRESSRSLQNS